MKLVIVGGVAGGATAAARARRLDENATIVMFERGREVSFANCGLPYYIGGQIRRRSHLLVQTEAGLEERFALDVRTRTEVTAIDRAARQVRVRELDSGRQYTEDYDYLLLAPGAKPVIPPIPGSDHPAVFTLRNLTDSDRIKQAVDGGASSALVVGGGFIGLEMVENLRRRGLEVALVELLPQVMPPLDIEVAARLHRQLREQGVKLYLSDGVTALQDRQGRVLASLQSGTALEVDLVILAVGVRPDTALAAEAGLELSERGAIVVDEYLRTSDPRIYAVGDAIQTNDLVLSTPTNVPLAGPANRQARVAVDNISGRRTRYPGVLGTSVLRLFDLTVALTGASEKTLRRRSIPFHKVYVHRGHHAAYFPGAQQMMIKLLFAPPDGRLLGAQIVGGEGVDKRIDVLATALRAGLTVRDLQELELAYAPQFGSAKDPINIAGYVAGNLLSGDEEFVYAEELNGASPDEWAILDVREPEEFAAGHIPGALHIPLGELRQRWQEIPRDRKLAVYCTVGQRAYYATRILRHRGLRPRNIAGGLTTYNLYQVESGRRCAGPLELSAAEDAGRGGQSSYSMSMCQPPQPG